MAQIGMDLITPKTVSTEYNRIHIIAFHEMPGADQVVIEWCWAVKDGETVTPDLSTRRAQIFSGTDRTAMGEIALADIIKAGIASFGDAKDRVLLQALIAALIAAGDLPAS